MRKALFLRIFLFLIGILALVFAVKVIADSGNPATITATYNTSTGQLSASGTYSGAPCNDRRVGLALFINGTNPTTSLPNSNVLDGTGMHVVSDNCTPSGSWADNSHNSSTNSILSTAPTQVCVAIYDVKLDKNNTGADLAANITNIPTSITITNSGGIANGDVIRIKTGSNTEYMKVTAGGGTTTLTVTRGYSSTTAVSHNSGDKVEKVTPKTGDLIGAGSSHNNDNSFENNETYPSGSCVTPTVISPSPSPTPTPTLTPTPSPSPSPSPTPTPQETVDVCANIDGIQTSVPDGKHLDASGKNCVEYQFGGPPPPPPAAGGQVLGATTLGKTGAAEENIFFAFFALGSILAGVGVRKFTSSKVR